MFIGATEGVMQVIEYPESSIGVLMATIARKPVMLI
jgi:hypothetical protein